MEILYDEYVISDQKSRIQLDTVCNFLANSYWANHRPVETIQKSIEHSVCFGVYHHEKQIGFARVVTDYATVYWLADVFIDDEYRGKEIGKKLIETITQSEELKNLTGILGTRDSHGLYEQYGFERDETRFMRRRPV